MDFPRLRLVWSFVRPHRAGLTIGMVLGLLATATGLATPMVTKWVLDSVAARAGLTAPIVGLLVLVVAGTVIVLVQWILLGSIAERVVLTARTSLIRRFLTAKVGEVTRHPPGELVTRVTSDTVLLREAASSAVIGLVNAAIGLVGTFVLMAVLDIVLLGITVALILVVLALFATLMPAIARAEAKTQEAVGNVGAELEGALRAIRTVKAVRAEHRQADRIIERAAESAQHSLRSVRATAVAWSISWAGIQVAIIVILGVGAVRVDSGALPVSSLIAFLLYAFQLMGPITELSENVTALQSGLAAAQRIQEVETMRLERGGTAPATVTTPAYDDGPVLELRGVSAGYRDGEPVVVDVDLVIPRRGQVAIVGPSGAGKTTLFSLLLRFLEPSAGEILLDGRPYSDLTVDQIRTRLGYVEQDSPLVPGSIRDNLLLAHPGAGPGTLGEALRAAQLDDTVAALDDGLDTPVSATSISSGQRQRIAIARALVHPPDMLLLDEATAQLDGLTEAAIQHSIRHAACRGAVITIAHRLSTVLDADLIVVMQNGRIRARGTHSGLLATDDLYRDLVHALRIAQLSAA